MRIIFEAILVDKEVRLVSPTGEYYTITNISTSINKFVLTAINVQLAAEQAMIKNILNTSLAEKKTDD